MEFTLQFLKDAMGRSYMSIKQILEGDEREKYKDI